MFRSVSAFESWAHMSKTRQLEGLKIESSTIVEKRKMATLE
jgi:hypothetical protein